MTPIIVTTHFNGGGRVGSLIAACEIYFPDLESNLGPLHWECEILAPGPPGKSQGQGISAVF